MKIIIDEFNGNSIIDVQLQDESNNIVDVYQGLTSDIASSTILMLSVKHSLSPDTPIIDNVFNDNEEVTHKGEFTLGYFLEE